MGTFRDLTRSSRELDSPGSYENRFTKDDWKELNEDDWKELNEDSHKQLLERFGEEKVGFVSKLIGEWKT